MDSSEQRAYYDRRYSEGLDRALRDTSRFYDAYFRSVEGRGYRLPPAGARALDIGCGSGGVLRLLLDRGYRAYGVDFSLEAIQQLRRRNLGTVEVADVQEGIPFGDRFDLIVCFELIEHLYYPEKALEHLRAKLAPGGLVVMTTPLPGTASDPSDVSIKPAQEWMALLSAAGLQNVSSVPVRYLPFAWRLHRRLGRLIAVPPRLSRTVLYIARG